MSVMRLVVRGERALRGQVRPGADVQIAQRVLLLAALGNGQSTISGIEPSAPTRAMCAALGQLGVHIERRDGLAIVDGVGLRGLCMPSGALDAGRHPLTLELLITLVSCQHFGTRIVAAGPAARRELRSVIEPLRARGAHVRALGGGQGDQRSPVAVAPLLETECLSEAEMSIPSGDASAKTALLLSGLFTAGLTAIEEQVLSADHAERALLALGVPLQTMGGLTQLDVPSDFVGWPGFAATIPGDGGTAGWLTAAALGLADDTVHIECITKSVPRLSCVDTVIAAGANLELYPRGDAAGLIEPTAAFEVSKSRLRGMNLSGDMGARVLFDLPQLCALVPSIRGRLRVRDVPEDRALRCIDIGELIRALRAFGIDATEYSDGLDVDGGVVPQAARFETADASAAALALVLAVQARGESTISPCDDIDTLYPGLVAALTSLGADIDVESIP